MGIRYSPHTHPVPIRMGIPIPTAALVGAYNYRVLGVWGRSIVCNVGRRAEGPKAKSCARDWSTEISNQNSKTLLR